MESFTSTVKSQTIPLDGMDKMGTLGSISIGYWYENSANDTQDAFMPPKIMERSFYKTLEEFPILSGRLKAESNNRLYVDIDKDDLNMPAYTDTCCDLEYSNLRESGFNIHKLPIDLRNESGVPVPSGLFSGDIIPAHFRIIRFKDNGGVFVYAQVAHYITDGYGYTQFMNRWAEISRWMQQPQDANMAPLPEPRSNWWSKSVTSVTRALSGNRLGKPANLPVNTDVNIRWRSSNPDAKHYMGNMVVGKSIKVPQKLIQVEPTDESLSELALKIHQAISSATEQRAGRIGNILNKASFSYTGSMLSSLRSRNKLGLSNHSKFPHYEVDFGAGAPSMVRHAPNQLENYIYVMPANPKTGGGYILEMNISLAIEAHLVKNNNWMKLVDSYHSWQ
ncbi:hypothetical protein EV175_006071 [Coemansia sp. RSA 1933]|nr:hypothetical protein EV175_006071 [Coemansia sp. RSA 1933]